MASVSERIYYIAKFLNLQISKIGHDFPVLPLLWHSLKNKNNSKFIPNLEILGKKI